MLYMVIIVNYLEAHKPLQEEISFGIILNISDPLVRVSGVTDWSHVYY